MKTIYVSGFGSYSPDYILTNKELETRVDTTDEWIVERTGIKARHIMADDQIGADLGANAAKDAFENIGMEADDITHIVNATCSTDYLCPSNACIVSSKLGINSKTAFDINAACSGFLYGLEISRGLLYAQDDAKILLIGQEALSRRINWEDRSTCFLFADGAGASVLSTKSLNPKNGYEAILEDVISTTDTKSWNLLTVGGGTAKRFELGDKVADDFYIQMNGREVFKFAVRSMSKLAKEILERNNLTLDDIDLVIPHQANVRIIDAVADRLGIDESKVFVNVDKYGNTSAASIPLAFGDVIRQNILKPGMRVLCVAFGGGFTCSAGLLKF